MHKTWKSDRLDTLEYYTAYEQYITEAYGSDVKKCEKLGHKAERTFKLDVLVLVLL